MEPHQWDVGSPRARSHSPSFFFARLRPRAAAPPSRASLFAASDSRLHSTYWHRAFSQLSPAAAMGAAATENRSKKASIPGDVRGRMTVRADAKCAPATWQERDEG
eukprot:scaffold7086_cov120-Isochrysis_galbana.AAC.1